jgi:hypothetical protein
LLCRVANGGFKYPSWSSRVLDPFTILDLFPLSAE